MIRIIGICVNFCKSSSTISRMKSFLNFLNRSNKYVYNVSLSWYNLKSMYISSRINIFSNVEKCHCRSNSSKRISSSNFNKRTVVSVFTFRISVTPIKRGVSLSIMVELGEIETSQSVKAYKASSVLSGETPGAKWMITSTFAEVLSSIFFILIFPFSFAFKTDSIKDPVVVPNGISCITSVLLSTFLIFARTRTFPPRSPSL